MSTELWEWWEGRLTRLQRHQLMDIGREALTPDLAPDIALKAGTLLVVQRTRTVAGEEWHLTEDAARLIGDREYERRHPDEDAPPTSHTV